MLKNLLFLVFLLSGTASAEWILVGENPRSKMYIDTDYKISSGIATAWVMFDYKSVQVSERSGRRYRTEKAQWEIDCQKERTRRIFFSWHAEGMGNGKFIYSSSQAKDWEPTSAPDSMSNAAWKFVCQGGSSSGLDNWPGKADGYGPPTYSYVRRSCGDFLRAQPGSTTYEGYLALFTGYIEGINSTREYGGNVLGKDNPRISDFALMVRSYCEKNPMELLTSGISVSLEKIEPATWLDMK